MKKIVLFALSLGVYTAQSQITHKYSFDNGTADDEVGSINGTMTAVTLTTDRNGNPDKALKFNGTSSKVSLGKSSLLLSSTGSISVWVKKAGNAASNSNLNYDPIFIAKNTSTGAYFEGAAMGINRTTGSWLAVTTSAGNSSTEKVVQKTNVSNNVWHHIVMTYDINKLTFYVDGVSAGNVSKGYTSSFSTSYNAIIGSSDNTTYSGYFNGDIDDLVIYDVVLTPNEVSTIFSDVTTSVEKDNANTNSNIFPNPATNLIHFHGYAQLYDLTGNKLMEGTDKLDVSNLNVGIYMLKQNNRVQKFIKE
jgi:hypothetical protein